MKFPIPAFCLILVAMFAGDAAAQAVPADSDPVMQGSTDYSLPASAIDAEIAGKVVVAVRIDESGNVTNAAIISGPIWPCGTTPTRALDDLVSTLTDTMRNMRFSPAIRNGKPVTQDLGITIELKNPNVSSKPTVLDPETGKPRPRYISGGILNGKATYLAKPRYPDEARGNRDAGSVSIQVLIDEDGKVARAGALNGAVTLQYAAREAACESRFTPTLLKGNPILVSGVITYNFVQ